MKKPAVVSAGALGILALLQLSCQPTKAVPAKAEAQVPPDIRRILHQDCSICHSDKRWFAWFKPVYWQTWHDGSIARQHLNFSKLGFKTAEEQRATLFEAVNMVQFGVMPLPKYVQRHPGAKMTPEELTILKNYLAPWGPLAQQSPPERYVATNLGSVKAEWNGVAFEPDLLNWSLLSVTDRGDNNTFRFVLGNDVAMKALASHNISPWPDGTKLAKVTWQQAPGNEGLTMPGNFVQVELMVKDASRYKANEGWGWGRWRGLHLQRYGNDSGFVGECTGCHKPLHGNDYVYTLPITRSATQDDAAVNNSAAMIGDKLLPLSLRPLTIFTDRKTLTISVLFGNYAAASVLAGHTPHTGTELPAGAKLALVTWHEREDPHWFGARIPDAAVSLETLSATPNGGESVYQRLNSEGRSDRSLSDKFVQQRKMFLLSLKLAP